MADDVWAWCDKTQAFGRTVTVEVKYADFQQITRGRTHADAVVTQAGIRAASLRLIRLLFPVEKGFRLVSVTVAAFEAPPRNGADLLSLFAPAGGSADPDDQASGISS